MLELQGITVAYGESVVLKDLSLTVPEGRTLALLGANGAGKTTTLRAASGVLKPASGRLLVDGVDLSGAQPYRFAKAGICHVPEGRGVFPSLTVRENLVLQSYRTDSAVAVERAVSAFPRLGQKLAQTAGTMSGGEQQMLALARAYVQQPRVVLLDEVSMGLAPKVVDEIFAFLTRLAEEGVSLLLVEQYVSKALAISDYVAILSRGRLVFLGEPDELAGTDIFAQYLGSAEQVTA
ncbi:MAG: livF [Frankiales bacterium]|nr:livF [Frankiales bacterium]